MLISHNWHLVRSIFQFQQALFSNQLFRIFNSNISTSRPRLQRSLCVLLPCILSLLCKFFNRSLSKTSILLSYSDGKINFYITFICFLSGRSPSSTLLPKCLVDYLRCFPSSIVFESLLSIFNITFYISCGSLDTPWLGIFFGFRIAL